MGVDVYAVSVDPPAASRALRDRLGLKITFLSDPDGRLLDELGILHRNAPRGRGDIAYPTSMLVDGYGVIRWIFAADNYRQRARPMDVFHAIEALGTTTGQAR